VRTGEVGKAAASPADFPPHQNIILYLLIFFFTQSIFNTLNDVIEEYNIKWENILSTCFDGAATMAGSTAAVQTKFKEMNKNIFFVHCYSHCLNLILVDSVGYKNRIAFDFFGTIQLVYNFIESSCSRHAIFEQIVNSTNAKLKTLKSLSNTR